jgi:MoaA/NifB/PqqE/SkfB family radical SAM enzyme
MAGAELSPAAERLARAVADGRAGDRLWLYATYHCNLACSYCLTESTPWIADRRELGEERMLTAAVAASEHGFRSLGVTGGEIFMLRDFPGILAALADVLPTLALTNGTLFTPRLLDRLDPLVGAGLSFQLSLDAAAPADNDQLRGDGNHAAVLDAIGRLRERGHHVRIATTLADEPSQDLDELCELHRGLGIPDDDHLVRRVVRRGKADVEGLGVPLGPDDVLPELTLTAEGAFLHPFAPTVRGGITDLDLRVADAPLPFDAALDAFLAAVESRPGGDDVVRNVR